MADVPDLALVQAELRARAVRARDPYDEAVWRLILGEGDAGLALLRSAIDALARAAPSLHTAALALMADDARAPALAAAAADDALRFVSGDREYHATLLALIAGDDDRARSHLADLRAYTASHDKLRGGRPSGVADIPGGLVDGNADRVSNGLATLLAWHLRRARARSEVFNSARGVISQDAIVAMLLAHRRGLAVTVDPTYRAARVPLLVIHLTEWQGTPLPRALPISIDTDLIAGPWLRSHGLAVEDRPQSGRRDGAMTAATTAKRGRETQPSTEAEQAAARQALTHRMRRGGTPWQLASWSLVLGQDVSTARGHLQVAAADAKRRWQSSVPNGGGLSRLFNKDRALPNQNIVREHFGLVLALGDEGGIREAVPALGAWLRAQEGKAWGVYAHTAGYLDLICDLLGGGGAAPARSEVDQVGGPLPSTRVAAIGLFERDAALLRKGLETMLREHAKELERKTAPPAPICEAAVYLAVAARRLGVPAAVDQPFAAWPVPIEGARIPCDLLGRALWTGLG